MYNAKTFLTGKTSLIDISMNYIRKSKEVLVDVVYATARQTRNGVDDKRSPDKGERQQLSLSPTYPKTTLLQLIPSWTWIVGRTYFACGGG